MEVFSHPHPPRCPGSPVAAAYLSHHRRLGCSPDLSFVTALCRHRLALSVPASPLPWPLRHHCMPPPPLQPLPLPRPPLCCRPSLPPPLPHPPCLPATLSPPPPLDASLATTSSAPPPTPAPSLPSTTTTPPSPSPPPRCYTSPAATTCLPCRCLLNPSPTLTPSSPFVTITPTSPVATSHHPEEQATGDLKGGDDLAHLVAQGFTETLEANIDDGASRLRVEQANPPAEVTMRTMRASISSRRRRWRRRRRGV